MPRQLRALAPRVALALVVALSGSVLSGCNQAPALTKVELDEGKLSEKHPKVDPEIAMECRKCHREQPAIKQ
jgi:hypothetical protein